MRFLECQPNLNQEEDYVEETSLFYNNPMDWLKKEYEDSASIPTYLIIFDVLKPVSMAQPGADPKKK